MFTFATKKLRKAYHYTPCELFTAVICVDGFYYHNKQNFSELFIDEACSRFMNYFKINSRRLANISESSVNILKVFFSN